MASEGTKNFVWRMKFILSMRYLVQVLKRPADFLGTYISVSTT